MRFHHPVVVQPQPLTEGVLCDLESAIGVTSQRRGKKELDRKGEARLLQRLA
jgi:hypothetical protein